jgi:hypothetical protein
MSPKDYQNKNASEPGRTQDKAEGAESTVDSALKAKGMQTGDENQRAGTAGHSEGGAEPKRTPGRAEG